MNRGSYIAMHSLYIHICRFNEAPIHESGKCQRGNRPAASNPRFNEAPIHESGKSRHRAVQAIMIYWLQ